MPGVIPHLIAGSTLFLIGRYYFHHYFENDNKTKKLLLLAIVCLTFSFIPDLFLGIYFTTHILPYRILLRYHILAHMLFSPLALIVLLLLKYRLDTKREPIWIIGMWCIVLHIAMDMFFPEVGLLL